MVEINHRERFLRAKILYYGPAAGGKTTTLQTLHRLARGNCRQELVSVNTAQDRTILFDLLPLSTPAFRSYDLRFQIVAVPGQKFYGATRKMLLQNADSIVFVANSATDRWQENLQSMKEMTEYLLDHGIEPSTLPLIFSTTSAIYRIRRSFMKIMERGLNARGSPSFRKRRYRRQRRFGNVCRSTRADDERARDAPSIKIGEGLWSQSSRRIRPTRRRRSRI